MKQGIGFSVTINIIAIFIVVTFAFLVASLNYYKAYRVNNAISDSIEKYEGYNDLAKAEIASKLTSLGYVNGRSKCPDHNGKQQLNDQLDRYSYCVYEEEIDESGMFKYYIVTYLNFNIPVVNQTLNIPVKTYTEGIYYFSK